MGTLTITTNSIICHCSGKASSVQGSKTSMHVTPALAHHGHQTLPLATPTWPRPPPTLSPAFLPDQQTVPEGLPQVQPSCLHSKQNSHCQTEKPKAENGEQGSTYCILSPIAIQSPLNTKWYTHRNFKNFHVKNAQNFCVQTYRALWTFNSYWNTYYVHWKYFMCLIFVLLGDAKNFFTTTISWIAVCRYCSTVTLEETIISP